MKAVIYHADAIKSKEYADNIYKHLIVNLKKNLNSFGIKLVHLTLTGFEGLGDENHYFEGEPNNITYNREKFFVEFLKNSPDELYWLTEPDSRIHNMFPLLEDNVDLSLLYRHDDVHIPPAWRLVRKSALPFFEELLNYYEQERKDWWEGDSACFSKMWKNMGEPQTEGLVSYNGMTIELRPYKLYCMRKSHYTQQFKGHHKKELYDRELDKNNEI